MKNTPNRKKERKKPLNLQKQRNNWKMVVTDQILREWTGTNYKFSENPISNPTNKIDTSSFIFQTYKVTHIYF